MISSLTVGEKQDESPKGHKKGHFQALKFRIFGLSFSSCWHGNCSADRSSVSVMMILPIHSLTPAASPELSMWRAQVIWVAPRSSQGGGGEAET